MKKFKKLAAALSAAMIAVSAFSIPTSVSAYTEPGPQPYDYMVDEANIAWEEDYVRVYKDGTVASHLRDASFVAFKPADGAEITAETLGLPDGCEIEEQDYSIPVLEGKGWLMIPTGSKEKTDEIAALAENWVKSGIALTAKKVGSYNSSCMYSLGLSVKLKDTADKEEFLANYSSLFFEKRDYSGNIIIEAADTDETSDEPKADEAEDEAIYRTKMFSQDEVVGAGEKLAELKADEMVENATVYGISCAALHRAFKTETIGYFVPDDYTSAEEFIGLYAETMTNGNEAVIVVPCVDDENYGYVFADGGEGTAYTVKSHERYTEELNPNMTYADSYVKNSYDVYVLELNSDSDIDIELEFTDLNNTENYISKITLCYTLQKDETFKVSDRPTTRRQVSKFISENGNIKVNDDNAVVVIESAGPVCPYECTNPYNTVKPVLTEKDDVGETEYSCRKNSDGKLEFEFLCGGGSYSVYQYSLDSNEKHGLKFISAQKYNETAETPYGYVTSYNYTIEKNESGESVLSESVEKYEETPFGDVNFDSAIDLYDAVAIARYLIAPDSLNETELYAADFNRDGQKNIYDAIDIAKTLL